MKRIMALLFSLPLCAQTTPNLGLNVAAYNSPNWSVSANQNFAMLDRFLSGVAPLPALKTSTPGVFTNTQMNEYIQSLLGGCLPLTIYQASNGMNFSTDALTGCVTVPSGSTVVQSNAAAGYVINRSTTTNSVAGFYDSQAGANNVHLWGINPLCQDSSVYGSFTGVTCNNEFDQNISSTTTTGNGIMLTGKAIVLNRNFAAVNILRGIGPYPVWHVGFQCALGATGSGTCLNISPQGTGNNNASQIIQFNSMNSDGTVEGGQIYLDAPGNLHLSSASGDVDATSRFATSTLNQISASQFAGTSECSGGTKTINLPITYSRQPAILVFDETTAGGVKLTAKSTSDFTVSCTGAADSFDWMVVGNPK
jgi:hypothetical protein